MPDLPANVRKVINARADDALLDLYSAVKRDDDLGVHMACEDLVQTIRDELEAKRQAAMREEFE
jgi:hypothetical protein